MLQLTNARRGVLSELRERQMDKALSEHVSAQILVGRSIMGLSQKELADRIGVCCQQIYKYETGKCYPPVARLAKIARALNLSPLIFFEGTVDGLHSAVVVNASRRRTELLEAYSKLGPSERNLLVSIAKILVEATVPAAETRALKRA